MTKHYHNQRMLAHPNGVTQTLTDWAREYHINQSTLCRRLKTMPLEEALVYKRTRKPEAPADTKPRRTNAAKAITYGQERQRLIGIAVQRLADKGNPTCIAVLAKVDDHLAKLKLTKGEQP